MFNALNYLQINVISVIIYKLSLPEKRSIENTVYGKENNPNEKKKLRCRSIQRDSELSVTIVGKLLLQKICNQQLTLLQGT